MRLAKVRAIPALLRSERFHVTTSNYRKPAAKNPTTTQRSLRQPAGQGQEGIYISHAYSLTKKATKFGQKRQSNSAIVLNGVGMRSRFWPKQAYPGQNCWWKWLSPFILIMAKGVSGHRAVLLIFPLPPSHLSTSSSDTSYRVGESTTSTTG